MAESRVVTFTTDFGLQDAFVGIMHGVVASVAPEARTIDVCHAIPSYDVLEGAWTIAQAYRYFPARTVHVVVVDPGVGSSRRPILAETDEYIFVAPDNGVLSLVEAREPGFAVREITAERFFRQPVSQTFHGRDIFAPVAGWLAKGVAPADFGPEITDYARLQVPQVERTSDGLRGTVLKIDKFGNLITNVAEPDLRLVLTHEATIVITIGMRVIQGVCHSYSEGRDGELFGIIGSSGYLEIAARQDSAAKLSGVGVGEAVRVTLRAATGR